MASPSYSAVSQEHSEGTHSVYAAEPWSSGVGMFWQTYSTPKLVTVKSPLLKVPYLVTTTSLTLFLVFYNLVYKLEFLTPTESYGTSVVDLLPPLGNFWTCTDLDEDCHYRPTPAKDFAYCEPDPSIPSHGCTFLDHHYVSPETFTQSVFIATSMTHLQQKKQDFNIQNRSWITTDSNRSFIVGVENYLMKIRHSFLSQACDDGCGNTETQGFLHFKNESLRRIASCDLLGIQSAGCISNYRPIADEWAEIEACGSEEAGSDNMCIGTAWGDFIAVKKLLEAAGVDLDEKSADGVTPRRASGLTLVMEIKYTNDSPIDFWSSPWGLKWKYEYKLHAIKSPGMVSPDAQRTIVRRKGSNHREVFKFTGVTIFIQHTGSIRRPSVFHAVLAFVVSLSLLKVSSLVVEGFLLRLYGLTSAGRSLSFMFDYFKRDETVNVHEFEDYARQHRLTEAKRFADETRAKCLLLDIDGSRGAGAHVLKPPLSA
eukprot:TRINITY_DN13798_c0_g1_i1.p1 TRINITY_DN13798_c0_g1~~TRINITY_DN13798_c0_g1_i1.p1  ORF type:complete len:507 (+),score=78.01 TRINITY_DN13798_c0_g1_i1:70-1521(+)